MARYLLHTGTSPDLCGVVVAPFKGHQRPLRHRPALAWCRTGGHATGSRWMPIGGGPVTRMSSAVSIGATPHVTHRAPAIEQLEKGERY